MTLLPVGLVFNAPGTFREGQALVLIGPPVPTADAVALARTEPERAARVLTDELAAALRGLIVEADDRQTLRHLRFAEELWRVEGGEVPADPAGRVAWLRSAMRSYRLLLERAPERVAAFRQRLAELEAEIERSGLGLARARAARDAGPDGRPRGLAGGGAAAPHPAGARRNRAPHRSRTS